MGARVAELCVVEQKLDMAKSHLAETKVALKKSLEALEVKRKALSDAE